MAADEARTRMRRPAIADSDARLEAENRILFGKGPFSESEPHGLFVLEPISRRVGLSSQTRAAPLVCLSGWLAPVCKF